MNEKKVENMHTKPRGKGQCSPDQTCPEVPLVLYRFLILIDAYLSCGQNGETKTHPVRIPDFIYLFDFETRKCDYLSLTFYSPYRRKIQPLCVYMFVHIYNISHM